MVLYKMHYYCYHHHHPQRYIIYHELGFTFVWSKCVIYRFKSNIGCNDFRIIFSTCARCILLKLVFRVD